MNIKSGITAMGNFFELTLSKVLCRVITLSSITILKPIVIVNYIPSMAKKISNPELT